MAVKQRCLLAYWYYVVMIKLTALTKYQFGIKKFFDRVLGAIHGRLTQEDDRRDLVEKNEQLPIQPQSLKESEKAMSEL